MSATWISDKLLDLPLGGMAAPYPRNFLRQAVCELRFPTLYSLVAARPPNSFALALRKAYPHSETASELTVNIGSNAESSNHHVMRSQNMAWTITLKSNAVSIETTRYTGFNEMRRRILEVLGAVAPIIESDFFTRIGLRYTNVVAPTGKDLSAWINSALLTPLTLGKFRYVAEYAGKMLLQAEDGGCLLQHGTQGNPANPNGVPSYIIDIDVFRTGVSVSDAHTAVDRIHEQEFALFDWCLGPAARDYLSSKQNNPSGD